jgi:O-antigen/teichoic acid export membrane protein
MWTAMAVERTLNGVFRLGVLGALALMHRLDVTSAVIVMCLAPLVGGLAYLGMLVRPAPPRVATAAPDGRVAPELLRFGFQVWLGSVAIELMGRMDQLLVTPLSNVAQLGLFIVAVNISDVPYIVTQTVREVTFGATSAEADTERLLTTSRIASLLTAVASLALGVGLPLWIGFVFGAGFEAAVVPTWILLLSSCLAVPGTIAGAGLDSVGRPALRSASLVLALVTNFLGLVLLVPPFGAVGAALAALVSTLASSVFVIVAASRVLHTASHRFFAVRGSDLVALRSSVRTIAGGLRPARNVP